MLKLIYKLFAFVSLVVLAACSFAPVYADPSISDTNFNLSFDQGTSRLEQIVYADLVAHFGRSAGPNSKNVHVGVGSSAVTPGSGSIGLTGDITVTNQDDEIIFSGIRTASATYVPASQALANQQAANEASERAAHELAQTIRLTLLGILSFQSNQ